MSARMHKRVNKEGEAAALCGDGRAKHLHNWWTKVDCDDCWRLRLPARWDRCEHPGCVASAVRWVDHVGCCASHAGLREEEVRDVG